LEDTEKQMLESLDYYSSERMSIELIDDDISTDQPPAKKPKGLSKTLGRCHGRNSAAPSTPQEKVKQQLDQSSSP